MLAGWVQVCGHNVPTIRTSVPHLRRGHPKGGDGWGQYSSQVSGEPIVVQMAAQPRPRILGQVQIYSQEIMFTLNSVEQKYLGGHLLEQCVFILFSPHCGYISSPRVACLAFTCSRVACFAFPPLLPLSWEYFQSVDIWG